MSPNRDVQLSDMGLRPHVSQFADSDANLRHEDADLESVPLLSQADEAPSGTSVVEIASSEEKVEVKIVGMTCSACSTSVEKALMRLTGVRSASVALLQNKAEVIYDSSLLKVCPNPPIFSHSNPPPIPTPSAGILQLAHCCFSRCHDP